MNRRADILTPNFVGLLIAIIGLVIIGIGVGTLYASSANQENTNARHFIDSLVGKIDTLAEDGVPRIITLGGFASKKTNGWALVSWSKGATPRPDRCYFKSCICVCPDLKIAGKETYIESCQKNGFCRLFEQEKIYLYDLAYSGSHDISLGNKIITEKVPSEVIESNVDLSKVDERLSLYPTDETQPADLRSYNLIGIPPNLIELEIKKESNKLNIIYPNDNTGEVKYIMK